MSQQAQTQQQDPLPQAYKQAHQSTTNLLNIIEWLFSEISNLRKQNQTLVITIQNQQKKIEELQKTKNKSKKKKDTTGK